MNKPYRIRLAAWQGDRHALQLIRGQVFMQEQRVSAELEWDGLDDDAQHLLAHSAQGEAIGCARLLPDGHIGRMAVLKPWRGQGVGHALLRFALDQLCQQQVAMAVLDAQVHAMPFYERLGFSAVGETFMDAGIPHRRMELHLTPARCKLVQVTQQEG